MVDLSDIRKEYTQGRLDESKVAEHPVTQFHAWFEHYRTTVPEEPTVMTVASVDAQGQPWQRILLLKSYDDDGFVFFTNYESNKGRQFSHNPRASLHFFWMTVERQVQVQGEVVPMSREEAQAYFHSRPRESQLGAWASQQSQPLASRSELETRFAQLSVEYQDKEIPLPDYWGGYRLQPSRMEFWQGGEHRLHDRVEYVLQQGGWKIQRLNP
ncbi:MULTISPECIES: pyridoxamine 5'-phosphate oxidase [unclassified Oceanobacter]|jgi:pyridoxamine 5'-phosphate oxidase|uniref:pyridoxamine 5'-phosphate oxidase n=1 Tax=unclassified Oceanobacter TaxID=2620260 RepID=UPI0026E1DF4A|nr:MULTISPECIES: pyridoxamine 5'-phosphate oxidase [unclassified Oceanobacter]MDO6681451.1 pyridoxamine 5'-phosphate oxidase [Oceanobacter sp. 5_MG-2023]MDP2548733.1 pyridoxamine 5'-phosphate oxidase [Oceanobacter sp. 4_MG-2023]MDP2609316.1 pyridoxamine 5'-phosphate oxidase [Oceanobacter sp. 1_MG-2023]MDP2612587.1 pyridoxamine 5'-phosphate oxidase [Oceanobacter sp. 2_MG-2023]